jgi:hypothetical protein
MGHASPDQATKSTGLSTKRASVEEGLPKRKLSAAMSIIPRSMTDRAASALLMAQ